MSILGGGPELGFCTPSDGNVYEDTTAGTFDSTRARCSIGIGSNANTSSYAAWLFSSGTSTPNMGFMGYGARPDFGGEYGWAHLFDGSGVIRAKLTLQRVTNTGSFETYVRLYVHNGSGLVQVGSAVNVNMGVNQKFDIALSSTSAALYVSKTAIIGPVAGSYSPGTVTEARVYAVYGRNYVSEMILADESTVRMRGRTDAVTAVTAVADWTGAASDVDEIVYSDATGITSASANDVSIFTASNPTLEFNPLAVLVGARGAVGTTGPTGLEDALRIGSTNYFSSTTVQSAGYGAKVGIWNTDPSTSAAWGATNAAAAKPGVKSIA